MALERHVARMESLVPVPERFPTPGGLRLQRLVGRLDRIVYGIIAYLPFGGGPRRCVGSGFAMTEAALLVAVIARRFRMTPAPGHPVKLWPTITLWLWNGMPLTLQARR